MKHYDCMCFDFFTPPTLRMKSRQKNSGENFVKEARRKVSEFKDNFAFSQLNKNKFEFTCLRVNSADTLMNLML